MAYKKISSWLKYLLAAALLCTLAPSAAFGEKKNSAPPPVTVAAASESQQFLGSGTAAKEFHSKIESRNIRVGFVNQPGSFSVDENGDYSGYAYDYLLQLAQYTGWQYTFVQATGADLNEQVAHSLEMLENGEVDLLGTMNYSRALAEQYEYPKNSYGYFHSALFAAENSVVVTKTNLYTLEKITVATKVNSPVYRKELETFCEKNGIAVSIQEYETIEEMTDAVNSGKADVLLDLDINKNPGLHTVATFQRHPIFFAAQKGDSEVTQTIDTAIGRMNTGNPMLQSTLYQKYYGASGADLSLTPNELSFASKHAPIKIGIVTSKAPIQSRNEETGQLEGVTKGVLDFISSNSGLRFEIVFLDYSENFSEEARQQEIDILAGLDNNYELATEIGVSLSAPYVTANTLVVFNKNIDPSNLSDKFLAIPLELEQGSWFANRGPLKSYNTIDACFAAVDSGQADYTYANTYTAPYYINEGAYTNLRFLPVSIGTSQTSFGFVSPIDPEVLLIFNKSIRSIPESTLSSMIYEASLYEQPESLWSFIQDHTLEIFIVIASILLLIITLLVLVLYTRMKAARAAREENLRHREIYSISNEHFFEYAPRTDTLLLSTPKNEYAWHNLEPDRDTAENEEGYRTYKNISTKSYGFLSADLIEAIVSPKKQVCDISCLNAEGVRYWLRITSRLISDESGTTINIVGKITDISDEVMEKSRLSEKARSDGLTGLLNRTAFEEQTLKLLSEQDCGAFLIVDVDKFKDVNDTYGHLVGDAALQRASELLIESFRPHDLIGRLGGDEFAICIKGPISYEKLQERCNKLLEKGVLFLETNGTERRATLSVGCVLLSDSAASLDYACLTNEADAALYEAKDEGRNCFFIHKL